MPSRRKIYKTKIKEWDIGKRLNDDDMLVILSTKAHREAADKQSEFWLLGKRVSEQNIRRYLRRKPELLTKYRRGHRAPPQSGGRRITCVTPPPPPETVRRAPGLLLDTERIYVDCRNFWRSSSESGTWILDPNGVCIGLRSGKWGGETADDMISKFFAAADLLSRSDFSGAFKILDLAFRTTGQLLQLDVPKLVPVLLLIYTRLDVRGQRDTLNIFRKYVQGQAANLEQASPGFCSLLQSISTLEVERYDDVFPRLFNLMIAESDRTYGSGSSLSMDVYYVLFAAYVIREDSQGQTRSLKNQLDKIPAGAVRGPWLLGYERLYAWKHAQVLRDQNRYTEALAALRKIEPTLRAPEDDVDASRHWHFVATVYRQMGDYSSAEKAVRRSLKIILMRETGPDADSVQFGSRKLAEILELMGRKEEADLVLQWSKNHIDAVASEVQWDWAEFERRTAIAPVRLPSPDSTHTLGASEHGGSNA